MKFTHWVRLMANEGGNGNGSGPGKPAAAAAPAPAAPIKIPSMKDLTKAEGAPAGTPPTPPPGPPAAPIAAPPAPTPPAAGTPAAAGPDDEPIIPTSIITPPGKTPEQFAKERREQKQQRVDEGQLQTQFAQATAKLVEVEAERDQLKVDRDRLAQEKENFERLAQTKEGEVTQLKQTWADSNRVTYDPGSDDEVRNLDAQMKRVMQEKLPITVPGQDDGNGQPIPERVFAEAILSAPEEQERLHGVLAHYGQARYARNNAAIDTAVNMMAQILGANVKMEGADPAQWKTLKRGDATFNQIETAMAAALPHFQGKIQRLQTITKEGPKFAVEAFGKRADSIRSTLATGIFLPQTEIQRRLQSDPHDPIALFAAIAAQAPDLRTEAEARLGRFANSFATVSDQLYVPTLRGNTPQDIEAHMQEVHGHRTELAKIMQYAVVGANSGKIIAQLIAERDAAEERAGKAAIAENPGSSSRSGGMGGPAGGEVDIPTTIVTR
jgi:hypothetical protein